MSKRNRKERQLNREQKEKRLQQNIQKVPDPPNAQAVQHMLAVQVNAPSGPFPPPEQLRQYDLILPGAAQRIIAMGERAQNHRHRMDGWEIGYGFVGMIFGLVIGLSGLAAGVYLGLNGQPWLGGTTITVTLGTLAVAFIGGRNAERKRSTPSN